jgi:hypothetical protein
MGYSGSRTARWRAAAVAFGGLSVLFATSGSAYGASGPSVKEPKYGFSLKLPARWTTIPLNGSDISSLLKSATHDDPALSNALNSQVEAATKQGIKVFAVGPLIGSFVPNVSIAAESSSGAPSGSAFPPAAAVQAKISLGQAGATQIKTSVIHNHMGAVAQVLYHLPLKTGTVYGLQLYVEHGSHIAIVTVTTPSSPAGLSVSRTVAANWKWLPTGTRL